MSGEQTMSFEAKEWSQKIEIRLSLGDELYFNSGKRRGPYTENMALYDGIARSAQKMVDDLRRKLWGDLYED